MLTCEQAGEADLIIADRTHPANRVTIRLKVSTYARIYSLEKEKEANKEEWAFVYVLGSSKQNEHFTQCLSSSFTYTVPSTRL
jgi:hypothetical protein